MVENPAFWVNYNTFKIRPIDRLINASNKERNPHTPQVVTDFVLGCRTIFSMMQQVNPDLVILPLRGAAPIGWIIEEFEKINEVYYPKVYPRVGDHMSVDSAAQGGYSRPVKESIIRADLKTVQGSVQRPLLIDEVQAGATLTQVAEILSPALEDIFGCETLYVIGAQDTRVMQRQKIDGYLSLVANEGYRFVTSTVNLPLFHIDRNEFLDYLLEPSEAPRSRTPLMLHTMHNTEAEEMFKNFTYGVLYPEVLLRVIKDVREGTGFLTGDKTADEIAARMSKWIKGLIVEGEEYYLKADNGKILSWLEELGNINLQR